MDDAINGRDVSIANADGIDMVDVDAIRVFRTIDAKSDVVHIGTSKLSIFCLGEAVCPIALFVTAVDNTVIYNDFHDAVLQPVIRETLPSRFVYDSGFDLVLQKKCNCFVRWSKTSIVATNAEELKDGALTSWTYVDQLQKFDVFAVVIVFLEISKYRFFLENIAGRGVYVFFAAEEKYDDGNGK
jgi:hypothetical protein